VLGNIFLFHLREESCLHFPEPSQGSRAAWSSLAAEPGPSRWGRSARGSHVCTFSRVGRVQLVVSTRREVPPLIIIHMLYAYMLFYRERCTILVSLSSNIHNHNHKSITEVESHSPEQSEIAGKGPDKIKTSISLESTKQVSIDLQ